MSFKQSLHKIFLGIILTLLVIPVGVIQATSVSQKVNEIKSSSKANDTTKAKPAQIKIFVNGQEKSLSDPIIMENGRVLLPVRALGSLLNIDVNYLAEHKVATATNSTAHLELPLGYNKAVKDKSIILPIDTSNPNTRTVLYNSRTYLPVRFISENLGYKISYADKTVSITTDGTTPTVPVKPVIPDKPVTPIKPPTEVKPPVTTPDSSKPPTSPGKKDHERTKDNKWIWYSGLKEWLPIAPGREGPQIDVGPIDLDGPNNGNWK